MDVNYGRDTTNTFPVKFVDPLTMFSGDIRVAHDGGFTFDAPIVITGSGPGPCNVLAIIADLDTTG